MAVKLSRVLSVVIIAAWTATACSSMTDSPNLRPNSIPALARAVAPVAGTDICGKPILDSPWSYSGQPGTFNVRNEPKGLPTIGVKKSNFPWATKIIVVPAGNNTRTAAALARYQVNKAVIYFEPGVHEIMDGMYTGHNSAYVGGYTRTAGKAILDGVDGATNGTGRGGNRLSASASSSGNNVYDTWEYLTIRNYTSSLNNSIMGNVNGGGSDVGDVYKYLSIGPDQYGYAGINIAPRRGMDSGGGYAIDAGSNTTIEYSCLTQNAQGAFNISNAANVTISHNDINRNGLGIYPDVSGPGGSPFSCGCSGGGKIFYSLDANFVDNYVHDNYNVGVWFDTDNAGANISGNYISSNWGDGIRYESSYNSNISGNTLVGNGWASNGKWPAGLHDAACFDGISCTNGFGPLTGQGGGNPYAAVDLSNSGGNGNLHTRYQGQLLVENNVLRNNFGGLKIYTDTNRYPDNIDNDSACSLPLGALNRNNSSVYYKQGAVLVTGGDATISGDTVQSADGTTTICAAYGEAVDEGPESIVRAPSVGMAVFNQNSGAFLGTVTGVTSAHEFTLSISPAAASGVSLMLSAYGGCGPADYYGGGFNVMSGKPVAKYWDNCIWGSRSITVKGNVFMTNAATVTGCGTRTNMCGLMEDAGFNAGVPKLMQFFDPYETYIAKASGGLGNMWSGNTYVWSGNAVGWQFMAGAQGHVISRTEWQQAPYRQDARSVFK